MQNINLNIFKEIYKLSLKNENNKQLYIGILTIKDIENILRNKDEDFREDFCSALFESANELK